MNRMVAGVSAVSTLVLLGAIGSTTCKANLIFNGDFESGNVGISTDYAFNASPNDLAQGEYVITDNPSANHSAARDYPDHTTGSGLMMMVFGSTDPNQVVWTKEVFLHQERGYRFEVWVSNWSTSADADLDFRINGVSQTRFHTLRQEGEWTRYRMNFLTGRDHYFTLEIVDLDTSSAGNAFALDDIILTVPEPASALLAAPAILPIALFRQRRGRRCRW